MKFSAATLSLAVVVPSTMAGRLGKDTTNNKKADAPPRRDLMADKMAKLEEKNADLERKLDLLMGKMEEQTKSQTKNNKVTGFLKNRSQRKARGERQRQLSSKKYYGYQNTKQVCYSEDTPQLEAGIAVPASLAEFENIGGLEFGLFDVYGDQKDDIMIEMTVTSLIEMYQAGAWVEDHTFIPGVGSLISEEPATADDNQAGPYQIGTFAGAFVAPIVSICDDIPQGAPYEWDYDEEDYVLTGKCGWAGYPDYYDGFSYEQCAYDYCAENSEVIDVAVRPASALPIQAQLWYGSSAILDSSDLQVTIKTAFDSQWNAETSTLKFFISHRDLDDSATYKLDFGFFLNTAAYRWQEYSGFTNANDIIIAGGAPNTPLLPNLEGFAESYIALGSHLVEVSKIVAEDGICNTEDDFTILGADSPAQGVGGLFQQNGNIGPGNRGNGLGLGLGGLP